MSIRDISEETPFDGDYSGRSWLKLTEEQKQEALAKSRSIGQARRKLRYNRTMTHREARAFELSGHKVRVSLGHGGDQSTVFVDEIRYRLI